VIALRFVAMTQSSLDYSAAVPPATFGGP
jgi:hypothetical protein